MNDLFADGFSFYAVPADTTPPLTPATPPRMAGLTTTRHADGTRTLAHGVAGVLGHYERTPDGWRGVTHAGQLVRARTETGVRRAIVEGSL